MPVDDATGKVVRISLYKPLAHSGVSADSGMREGDIGIQSEDDRLQLEKWI